jgi:hypothetical protein
VIEYKWIIIINRETFMKKFLFIFLGILISHSSFAQALTKNGQITTTGSTYVNKNGTIGGSTGVNKNGQIVLAAIPHAIGDSYEGGIIFYILQSGDPGYDANAQHGFIAAPTDQSTSTTWGCITEIGSGAQGTALGTGKTNTAAIIAGYTTSNCTAHAIAAQLCTSLNTGGYTDWYLPSENELTQLYNNQTYVGNLSSSSAYWSSTEYADTRPVDSANDAFYFIFPAGFISATYKLSTAYVRAIRSF